MQGVVPGIPVGSEPHAEQHGVREGLGGTARRAARRVAARVEDQRALLEIDQPGMERPAERQLRLAARDLDEAGYSTRVSSPAKRTGSIACSSTWEAMTYVKAASASGSACPSATISGLREVQRGGALEVVGHVLVDYEVCPRVCRVPAPTSRTRPLAGGAGRCRTAFRRIARTDPAAPARVGAGCALDRGRHRGHARTGHVACRPCHAS